MRREPKRHSSERLSSFVFRLKKSVSQIRHSVEKWRGSPVRETATFDLNQIISAARHRHRERDRDRERHRHRERDREGAAMSIDREREREIDGNRHRGSCDRDGVLSIDRERQTDRQTETERELQCQ